jgi:hypothetical protein
VKEAVSDIVLDEVGVVDSEGDLRVSDFVNERVTESVDEKGYVNVSD